MKNIIQLFPPSAPPKKDRPRNTMPDGRKRIRVDVGTDPETGKRIRKTFTGATLKECNAKKEAWKKAQQEAQEAADKPPEMTVKEWAEKWLDIYGSSAGYSQNRAVEIDVRRLYAYMGDKNMASVQQADIQSYARSVSDMSKSAVSNIKGVTKRIFEAALVNGIINRDPCVGVDWKHAGAGTHRFLEPWEIQLVSEHYTEHRAGLWAMLMLYAGLRRGEAMALRWEDVDMDKKTLSIVHGVHFEGNKPVLGNPKTKTSIRTIPIFPPLYKALQGAPRVSEYVCTGAQGQQVTEAIWAASWRAYNNTLTNILNGDTSSPVAPGHRTDREKPDRKKVSIRAHDLRHTFASLLYEANVDIKTAQKLMGHSTPDVTLRIYTHLSAAKEAANLDQLEAYFEKMGHKWGTKDGKSQ